MSDSEKAFNRGYDEASADLISMYLDDCITKFNSDYPIDWTPENACALKHAQGYLERIHREL